MWTVIKWILHFSWWDDNFLELVVKCKFLYLKSESIIFQWTFLNGDTLEETDVKYNSWGKQMWNTTKWYDIHVRQRPILDYPIHVQYRKRHAVINHRDSGHV